MSAAKRVYCLLLCLLLCFVIAGCRADPGPESEAPSEASSSSSAPSSSAASAGEVSSDISSSSSPSSASSQASSAVSSSSKSGSASISTASTGPIIPYNARLLMDFERFINLSRIGGYNFEPGKIDQMQLAFAGVMLSLDETEYIGTTPAIRRDVLEGNVKNYFGLTITNPIAIQNDFIKYKDGFYTFLETSFDGAYEFTAERAYDLGDNYIRVEGKARITDLGDETGTLCDAVIIIRRTPSDTYGYHLLAQKYSN